MAACGSLQHIFEKPLPENPTLLESLSSWNHVKPMGQPSFTEIFGELHFKDSSESTFSSSPSPVSSFPACSSSPPLSCLNLDTQTAKTRFTENGSGSESELYDNKRLSTLESFMSTGKNQYRSCQKSDETFSPTNHGSLQLCTEGLGFESSDDVENTHIDINEGGQYKEEKVKVTNHFAAENLNGVFRRSRTAVGAFPPPISCIGKSGKPGVCFKSYRHNGRFILKEVRIPNLEFLHASRKDGRLKLQFVHPNNETLGEAEGDEEDEDENFTEEEEESEEE